MNLRPPTSQASSWTYRFLARFVVVF